MKNKIGLILLISSTIGLYANASSTDINNQDAEAQILSMDYTKGADHGVIDSSIDSKFEKCGLFLKSSENSAETAITLTRLDNGKIDLQCGPSPAVSVKISELKLKKGKKDSVIIGGKDGEPLPPGFENCSVDLQPGENSASTIVKLIRDKDGKTSFQCEKNMA